MKDKILALLAALKKKHAQRAAELEAEFTALAEDKHGDFLTKLATESITLLPEPAAGGGEDPVAAARTALAEAKKIQAQTLIQTKLTESRLAGPALEYVRASFAARVADGVEITEAYLTAEIDRARTAFAAYSTIGRVRGGGPIVGLESIDKVQLAFDGMLGVKPADGQQSVKPFRGLREAYHFVTGESEVHSEHFLKTAQAIEQSNFPNLLLNSMTKRLLQDYAEVGMGGLDQLVTTGAPIADYKTQDRVREGYLGDLSTVTEGSAYTEFTYPTDERVSYAVAKRGNTLTITEETIRTDDLGAVARFPMRIARAARRTLKQYITNFFANNPNYGVDGISWFNASHNNLGSNPLSVDELIAREVALMTQTEKDSNKPLGFKLNWVMVPPGLAATAWKINRAEIYNPGPMIEQPNPYYQRFGANNERVIVNELLTDQNDFYWGTSQNEGPFLEIGYLDGYQQPQILLANLPTQGTLFTNDEIQYKVKFVFGGVITDYRELGKNVVA